MSVPLLDLSRQYSYLKNSIEPKVAEVLASSQYILGPPVVELEKKIAELIGRQSHLPLHDPVRMLVFHLNTKPIRPFRVRVEPHPQLEPALESVNLVQVRLGRQVLVVNRRNRISLTSR